MRSKLWMGGVDVCSALCSLISLSSLLRLWSVRHGFCVWPARSRTVLFTRAVHTRASAGLRSGWGATLVHVSSGSELPL